MHAQTDRVAAPRKIKWAALVATVLPTAPFATLWTRSGLTRRFDHEDQTAVALDDDQDDAPTLPIFPERLGHRDSPQGPG
jgi:hypothetical protein